MGGQIFNFPPFPLKFPSSKVGVLPATGRARPWLQSPRFWSICGHAKVPGHRTPNLEKTDKFPIAPSKKGVIWKMRYVFVSSHVGCKKTVSAAYQFRCHYKQLRDLEFSTSQSIRVFRIFRRKKTRVINIFDEGDTPSPHPTPSAQSAKTVTPSKFFLPDMFTTMYASTLILQGPVDRH